jgi:hypothetical protein
MFITRRPFFFVIVVLLIVLIPAIEGALRLALFWPLYVCATAFVLYAFTFNSARAKRAVVIIASCMLTITASDLLLRLTPIVTDE